MDEKELLREGERIDDLQRGGCRIIQDERLFCFGMDAVLLSAYAQVREGERVLDLCTGNGIVPILCEARLRPMTAQFTGIEIGARSVDLARRSVRLNGQEERIRIIEGDVKRAGELVPSASFDVVTANPPYMAGGHGLLGTNAEKAAARHELLCTLDDVTAAAARALRPGGRFCIVHRPFRMADLFRSLDRHALEVKRLRLVCPFAGSEPNLLLAEAVKGGRAGLKAEPPLVIYKGKGEYTEEVRRIYCENPGKQARLGRS